MTIKETRPQQPKVVTKKKHNRDVVDPSKKSTATGRMLLLLAGWLAGSYAPFEQPVARMLPLLLVAVAVVAVAGRVVFVICVHFGICFMAMRHAIQNRIVTTSPADKPTALPA